MATINDAQKQAYLLANSEVDWNPAAAICKKWLQLKTQGVFIGVPIGDELDLKGDSAGRQAAQAFTSGVVLVWYGGNRVEME